MVEHLPVAGLRPLRDAAELGDRLFEDLSPGSPVNVCFSEHCVFSVEIRHVGWRDDSAIRG